MKLISLNTWGAKAGLAPLLHFFEEHKDIDIFCLQEVWNGGEHMVGKVAGGAVLENVTPRLLEPIKNALPKHVPYFRPHFYDFYGLVIFVKKDLQIFSEGEVFIYKERGYISPEETGNHARNMQYIGINTPAGKRTIVNLHGLWNGKGKTDSDDRLTQSDNIINFIKDLPNPYLICGDFNLLPETQSMQKLEAHGLRNLIKEYNITSTRTSLYTKPVKFADYALVSQGIEVKDFKVLSDEVSDHAPLYLEFA